jgi:hypothetical protein
MGALGNDKKVQNYYQIKIGKAIHRKDVVLPVKLYFKMF